MPFHIKLAVSILFAALIVIFTSVTIITIREDNSSFEKQYARLVKPYAFNIAGWEARTLYNQLRRNLGHAQPESELTSEVVLEYFSYINLLQQIKADPRSGNGLETATDIHRIEEQISYSRPFVEQTLKKQISRTLEGEGIHNPFLNDYLGFIFPPVNFVIDQPPHTLIVSPRNKIERIRETLLVQNMSLSEINELETSLEKLNVSVLVERLGGLGATYPSFVEEGASLRFTIDTALEEWLHQYLAFKPLGFRYVLDLLNISGNADIPILNETAASIMSEELGSLVYAKFYAHLLPHTDPIPPEPDHTGFDFNREMREIRKTVDNLLELGQIDQAERYMAEKRDFLESQGYYIRKLNQAYFAFHGSYAGSPTSIDPVGNEMRLLRKNSPSIKDFLETVSAITSREDLKRIVSNLK